MCIENVACVYIVSRFGADAHHRVDIIVYTISTNHVRMVRFMIGMVCVFTVFSNTLSVQKNCKSGKTLWFRFITLQTKLSHLILNYDIMIK